MRGNYLTYLNRLEKFGMNLGLDRISAILEKLGNPHLQFKSIHIAGTNGKGSTAAMIASILKEGGYRVGLYTSPHLLDYRERIKINGQDIPANEFDRGLKVIERIAREPRSSFSGSRALTVFEVLTAAAFWYFAKEKVDYAVVEVGLGGRLDATNVITPLVSVITNIDYEHTEVLGKTLGRIAAEKAAIIKPGVPVVTAETKLEPLKVIKKTCRRNRSWLLTVEPATERRGSTKTRKPRSLFAGFRLHGSYQRTNAACAVTAIRVSGIKVSRKAIKAGLQKAKWPGRFQIIRRKPLTILDGAHNPAGARALRGALRERFPGKKFTFILGVQKDKDAEGMVRELQPAAKKIIATRSTNSGAACSVAGLRPLALKIALEASKYEDRVIAGSLYLIGDALSVLT